ncbi:MAG: phosphatase PAP2 family protein [Bacillota bacterium]
MDLILKIQSYSNTSLDQFFQLATMLGEDSFLILIAVIIYWCFDKNVGFRLGVLYCFSMVLNNIIKEIITAPRPVGLEGIRSLRLETATGYSFPSGHTQGTATFWTALAQALGSRTILALALAIIIVVGFSRLYLGVHYPQDVFWGAVFGIIVTLSGGPAMSALEKNILQAGKVFLIVMISILTVMLFVHSSDMFKASGALTGLMAGRYIEERYIGFEAQSTVLFNIIKFITGMAVLLGIKEGLKLALPEILLSDFIRYMAVGIWTALGAPCLFTRLSRWN